MLGSCSMIPYDKVVIKAKKKMGFFVFNFALFMEVCDTGSRLCRENNDASLLYFLKFDCQPNTSQSEKALTDSLFGCLSLSLSFFKCNSRPITVTALTCTTTLS